MCEEQCVKLLTVNQEYELSGRVRGRERETKRGSVSAYANRVTILEDINPVFAQQRQWSLAKSNMMCKYYIIILIRSFVVVAAAVVNKNEYSFLIFSDPNSHNYTGLIRIHTYRVCIGKQVFDVLYITYRYVITVTQCKLS